MPPFTLYFKYSNEIKRHSACEDFGFRRGGKIKKKSLLLILAQEIIIYLMMISDNNVALQVSKLFSHMPVRIFLFVSNYHRCRLLFPFYQ